MDALTRSIAADATSHPLLPVLPVLAACLPDHLPPEAPDELAGLVEAPPIGGAVAQRPGADRRQERRHAGLDLSAAQRRERAGVTYPRTHSAELRAAPGAGAAALLDPLDLARRLAALAPGALEVVRHLPDLVVPPPPGPSLWTPDPRALWTPGPATTRRRLWVPGADLAADPAEPTGDLGPAGPNRGHAPAATLLTGFAEALDQALHGPPDPAAAPGEAAVRVTATREAVRFFREAARQEPAAFLPDLATALVEHSAALGAAGRPGAVTAAEDAVAIRQHLAKHDRHHLPDLAGALHNLADRLTGRPGRHDQRVAALEDTVAIRRHLVQEHPARHLPDLAVALDRLAAGLAVAGRPGEQVVALEDAVAIRRHLAGVRAQRFLPDLAGSLHALSLALPAERRHEALAAVREAVTIRRRLADGDPGRYLPDLATSVHTLSVGLGSLGQHPEGLAAGEEATQLFGHLARWQPAPFTPDLADSLENLAISLGAMGRHEDARTAAAQAAALHQGPVAPVRPHIPTPTGGRCWCSCHDTHHGPVLDTTAVTGPTPVVVVD